MGLRGQRLICLVDHQNIGDFQDPCLDRLHVIAQPGCGDHHAHIGNAGHFNLGLAGADGFQNDNISPCGIHQIGHLRGCRRQSAQSAPRGQRADENACVQRVFRHADTVAQNGPPGDRAGRINRHHAHGLAAFAKFGDIGVDQRRFPRPRRAGETNDDGPAQIRADGAQDVDGPGRVAFDHADRARKRRSFSVDQTSGQRGYFRCALIHGVRQRPVAGQSPARRATMR